MMENMKYFPLRFYFPKQGNHHFIQLHENNLILFFLVNEETPFCTSTISLYIPMLRFSGIADNMVVLCLVLG